MRLGETVTLAIPGVAVGVVQLAITLGTAATVKPAGKLSVTIGFTTLPVLAVFAHVMVAVLFCNKVTEVGLNDLLTLLIAIVGLVTERLAVAAAAVVCCVLTTLIGLALFAPATLPVTSRVMLQLAFAGIVPPAREKPTLPVVILTVPLQVFTTFGAGSTK